MSGETLVIIEMTATATLCLGFGFYQLWSLDKDKKKALLEKQLIAEAASAQSISAQNTSC